MGFGGWGGVVVGYKGREGCLIGVLVSGEIGWRGRVMGE
jgi:hypothetical protein